MSFAMLIFQDEKVVIPLKTNTHQSALLITLHQNPILYF